MNAHRIEIDLPAEPLFSLKETPEHFAKEMKMLAAVKLFELGRLSSGRAAQLAGIPRVAFLMRLADYRVAAFELTREQLAEDAENAYADLRAAGLWIGEELAANVIAEAGEGPLCFSTSKTDHGFAKTDAWSP